MWENRKEIKEGRKDEWSKKKIQWKNERKKPEKN
jgi:hypothetical protein